MSRHVNGRLYSPAIAEVGQKAVQVGDGAISALTTVSIVAYHLIHILLLINCYDYSLFALLGGGKAAGHRRQR